MTQFPAMPDTHSLQELIQLLSSPRPEERNFGASGLFALGVVRVRHFLDAVRNDPDFRALIACHKPSGNISSSDARITVGIAVTPRTFEKLREANGTPLLAAVPPDQDAAEFELLFSPHIQLDILTTVQPGGGGAIDRFLHKFGEGIQQVELDVTDIELATDILRARFQWGPVYPATRSGADQTRVNFFLVPDSNGKKLLLELVEQNRREH
jgi:hypothetical protein